MSLSSHVVSPVCPQVHIGTFETLEAAQRAHDRAFLAVNGSQGAAHGVQLNFPAAESEAAGAGGLLTQGQPGQERLQAVIRELRGEAKAPKAKAAAAEVEAGGEGTSGGRGGGSEAAAAAAEEEEPRKRKRGSSLAVGPGQRGEAAAEGAEAEAEAAAGALVPSRAAARTGRSGGRALNRELAAQRRLRKSEWLDQALMAAAAADAEGTAGSINGPRGRAGAGEAGPPLLHYGLSRAAEAELLQPDPELQALTLLGRCRALAGAPGDGAAVPLEVRCRFGDCACVCVCVCDCVCVCV